VQQQVSTEWSVNSRLLIRRTVIVPAGATNVRIMLSVDNDAINVYFNGHLIASNIRHESCPIGDEFRIDVGP